MQAWIVLRKIARPRDALAPLLTNPQVSEAWCGFRGVTVEGRKGVRVALLDPQGPAQGHLKADDLIEQADGAAVTDYFDFLIRVVQHKPEEKIALRVLRAGQPVEVTLTLARLPMPSPKELLRDKLGIAVQDLTRAVARKRGIPLDTGLLITEAAAGSPAEQAGLAEGDVIVKIESSPVRNLQDAAAALRTTMAGDAVSVLVFRQNYLAYAKVVLAK